MLPDADWAALGEEAIVLLRRYLAIDTSNPPGNETAGVVFLASLLEKEGIATEIAEAAPGRGNLTARLLENGLRPGLVLHHHVEVVPADARHWTVEPFGGAVEGGFIYGRGALDMKALGIIQLLA